MKLKLADMPAALVLALPLPDLYHECHRITELPGYGKLSRTVIISPMMTRS
jgi:hypothetical protein